MPSFLPFRLVDGEVAHLLVSVAGDGHRADGDDGAEAYQGFLGVENRRMYLTVQFLPVKL